MISASSSAWSLRLLASSWNNSARSRPAKPRHSRSPALARSTTSSISSREETPISSMLSSVVGLMTLIVLSKRISFRPLQLGAGAIGIPLGRFAKRPTASSPPQRADVLQIDGDIFGFEVLLDAFGAALTSVTGLLDAPEGRRRVGDHTLIEADHAGLQALAHAQGALEVAGVDVGHEAELRVVGGGNGGLFRVEGGHGGHGAEDLLFQQRGVFGDAVEHGGTVKVAGTFHLLAPDQRPRSLAQSVVDELGDLAALGVVDEWPYLDVFLDAAADFHGLHSLRELLGELASDIVCDVEAVGGGAGLPDVAHLGHESALHGGVHVRVVEDQEGGVAAELHGDPQDLLRRLLYKLTSDLCGARKRQLARPRVGDQGSHRAARRRARHHVQHATRQPRLFQNRGERQHGKGRLLGRFDHHRAPGRDRWPDLARAHGHREVPGRYEEAGPNGLLHGKHAPDAGGRYGIAALDAHGLFREPAEELGGVGDLRLGLRQRLAHLQRHQEGELVGALYDLLEGATEDLTPLARSRLAPLVLHPVGRVQGGHGILGRGVGDLAQRLGRRRILDDERATPGGPAPLSRYKELLVYAVYYRLLGGCYAHRGSFLYFPG